MHVMHQTVLGILFVLLWREIRTGLELLVVWGKALHQVAIAGHSPVTEDRIQFYSRGSG